MEINIDTAAYDIKCDVLEFEPKASRFIDNQNYYYYGVLINEDTTDCLCFDGEIMLEASNGRQYGYFTIGEFKYEILAIDDEYSVVAKMDTAYFAAAQECLPDSLFGGENPEITDIGASERSGTACRIRVLFLYTQAAEDAFGGLDGIRDMTSSGISQTNQAFTNSQITDVCVARANIREWEGFDEDALDAGGDLNELQTDNQVATWRQTDLADVVCLITNGNYGNGNLAGLAGANLGNPVEDRAFMLVEGDFFFIKIYI